MNKLIKHFFAFFLAIIFVFTIYISQKENIINHYTELKPSDNSIALKDDMESGKIVMFGSSELGRKNHKFIPENFFNKDLKLPLTAIGSGGHKEFCILTEIASVQSQKTRENARVIVVLSAGWFFGGTQGTVVPNFIKYVDSWLLTRLYFESDVSNKYKLLASNYIKNHWNKIENPSFIYKYAHDYNSSNDTNILERKFIVDLLDNYQPVSHVVNYKKPILDYSSLRKKAIEVAEPATNNPYGIINSVFTKTYEKKVKNGTFPYDIPNNKIDLNTHREFQDFKDLVALMKDFKHKPLFIFIDSNPLGYVNNRERMFPVLDAIKDTLNKHNFGFLNMWTYDKSKFKIASMVDQSHTGELGWIEINKKIIEHFMKENED